MRNQEPAYPRGKTLFVLNIPPYATVESLKNAFASSCGPVKSVTLIDTSGKAGVGFKNAYVVFTKDSGLSKVLSLPQEHTLTLSTKEAPVLTGLRSKLVFLILREFIVIRADCNGLF